MTHTNDTKPQQLNNPKPNRVQLKHVLLDVDFFEKPTIRDLDFECGPVALLLLVRWLMLMSRATNALVTKKSLLHVGRELRASDKSEQLDPQKVLDYCIRNKILHEREDGISNERVEKDQERCAVKRKQNVERQEKLRRKRNALHKRDKSVLPVTVTVTDSVSSINLDKIVFPPKLDHVIAKSALDEWLEYKRQRGEKYKSLSSIQKLLNQYSNLSPPEFAEAVNHSMANNYKGLFPKPKEFSKNGNHQKSFEQRMEDLAKL